MLFWFVFVSFFTVILVGYFSYCTYLKATDKKSKASDFFALLCSFIMAIIALRNSIVDISEFASFNTIEYVSLNSTIYAEPQYFFTVRYTLDGSSPAKNGILYDDDGIIVKKENIKNNELIITYQIGIGNFFYFTKKYTQKYTLDSIVQLNTNVVSEFSKMNDLSNLNSNVILLHSLIIDGVENGDDIIDGDINTKKEFNSIDGQPHTLIFSESNSKGFSKFYIRQKDISQIKFLIDNMYEYDCKFDFPTEIDENDVVEIDFQENISVLSSIRIDVYSNKNKYYINDVWFDYYLDD